MKKENISEALTDIQESYIEGAADYEVMRRVRQKQLVRWGTLAACLCLVLSAAVMLLPRAIPIEGTAKVSYSHIGFWPIVRSGDLLVELSEDELFEREDMLAFRGRVVSLKNITIDFGGGAREHRCIAEIGIIRDYRGDMQEGDVIRVLLPCPITSHTWVEDSDVISELRVDMEGIFMPIDYHGDSRMEMNGKWVNKAELAPCGLDDGIRWVFLQTEDGLIFDRYSYLGAAGVFNLDTAEQYVIEMLR